MHIRGGTGLLGVSEPEGVADTKGVGRKWRIGIRTPCTI
jgi:hypothetical protein